MGVVPITSRKPLKAAKPAEYTCQPCTVRDLRFAQGICGERFDTFRSPQQCAKVAPAHDQTLAPAGYLLIPFFGKLHYVSPALYKKEATKYHELHWKEAWNLLDSIRFNRSIYDELINPRRFMDSFVAGAVEKWTEARALWDKWIHEVESAPKPDVGQFDVLSDRTFAVIHRLAEFNYEADHVAKNGFDLQAIRQDLERLLAVIRQYRENSIESAEQITSGLETVESTAFQILNVVPIITLMDPLREAAYRISVLLVRAGARGAGGYLAIGTLDSALREAFAILQREAPYVIVDVILAPVNRLCGRLGMGRFSREACALVVKQIIEFACAYYRMAQENADGKLTDQQFEQLLSERLAVLVGDIAGIFLSSSLGEKAWKTLVKSIADSVLRTLLIDINNAKTAAKEQNREVLEVLMSDLPGTIMRIIQGTVVGLIQRRARQSSEFIAQQRAVRSEGLGDGLTYSEALDVMRKTNWSEWARDGIVSKTALAGIRHSRRPPLPAYTYQKHTSTAWKDTNLEYITAARIRRFAHDNELVVIAHAPSQLRQLHTHPAHRGAKSPKPMAVKAKSSDHPDAPQGKQGLVVKPVAEGQPGGPTHKDFAAAKRTWVEEAPGMFAAGYMVRDDGVVFHPDQIANWAALHPEDAAACSRAVRVLREAAAHGYHDLTMPPPPKVPQALAAGLSDIKGILNKAQVGFYSDLDLVEVVDFRSGARRFMGDKGDGSDALLLARDNRQHMNEEINITHDYMDPEIPDGIRQLARLGDQIQHGASSEIEQVIVARTSENVQVPLKHVFMVFPAGDLVVIDERDPYVAYKIGGLQGETRTKRLDHAIRDRIEQELKKRLGDKYQDFANRAQNVRKSYDVKSPRYQVTGQPPPVTPKQIATIRSSFREVEILDEPGLGYEVPREEIEKSLLSRRMSLDDFDVEKACSSRMGSPRLNAARLWNQYRALIAVDYDHEAHEPIGRNIVIAVSHYRQTVADAVEGLLQARRQLGTIPAVIQVWFELYTAYFPVCSNHVANRIGGPDPGVRVRHEELAEMVSCFRPRKNEHLYAFAAGGFADTYAPIEHKSVADKRSVQGMVLMEVWENEKNRRLIYRKVEAAEGRSILVFPECVIASRQIAKPMKGNRP